MRKALFVGALSAIVAASAPAFAEGDASKGKAVFKRCVACHNVDKEKNKVGPHLVNIIGRKAGAVDGFKYSKSLEEKAAGGLEWTKENLSTYLENPKKLVPKGRMAFVGLKKAADRDNVIAYLEEASKK